MLGIEVSCDRDACTLRLLQHTYIEDILCCFNFDDLKPILTPMDPHLMLLTSQSLTTPEQSAIMQNISFCKAISSLIYASLGTCLDITFAVSCLSKFLQNLRLVHWEVAKHVFCYLKGMNNFWLTYGERGENLTSWVDADDSQEEDRRAITGYAFLIDGGAISWNSKQQELVVLSTTDEEYVAATHAIKEALWLHSFILEVFGNTLAHTTIFSNNKSMIELSKDHQYHACTKHIDI